MEIFSKKKKEKSLELVFDIGSGSVGGAIVEINKEKPKVFYAKRVSLRITPQISAPRLEEEILKLLKEISHTLLKKGLNNLRLSDRSHTDLEFCHIFLSSPWYYPEIKIFNQNKTEKFVVTKEMLEEILEEGSENDEEVFEKKIVSLKLDGYQAESLLPSLAKNTKVNEIELVLFKSRGERAFLKKIEETIERDFTSVGIFFHTFMSSLFSFTRDLDEKEKNFLLIDITSEVTDISIVKEGVLLDNISFPKGKNFFLRKISEKSNTSPQESLSALNAFLSGGGKDGRIQNILTEAKSEFLHDLSTSLNDFKQKTSIPRKVFLTVDEGLSLWFKEVISEEEFIQGGVIGKNFAIQVLNQGMLSPYLSKARAFDKDVFLSIETIFLNKIFEI